MLVYSKENSDKIWELIPEKIKQGFEFHDDFVAISYCEKCDSKFYTWEKLDVCPLCGANSVSEFLSCEFRNEVYNGYVDVGDRGVHDFHGYKKENVFYREISFKVSAYYSPLTGKVKSDVDLFSIGDIVTYDGLNYKIYRKEKSQPKGYFYDWRIFASIDSWSNDYIEELTQKLYIHNCGEGVSDLELSESKVHECVGELRNEIGKLKPSFKLLDNYSLKEYLQQCLFLETTIYTLQIFLKQLYQNKFKMERQMLSLIGYQKILKKASEDSYIQEITKKITKDFNKQKRMIEKPLPLLKIDMPEEPQKPVPPILVKPGLFNKKRVIAENNRLENEYAQKCAEYEENYKKYKEQLKIREETLAKDKRIFDEKNREYKSRIKELEKQKEILLQQSKDNISSAIPRTDLYLHTKELLNILNNNINDNENLLKKYMVALEEYYAQGIIFGKYRNLIALSSMCEYITSGRCKELEGSEGAYNIYESELRMNTIVSQLSKVVESLEQIKNNQFVLYDAIEKSNNELQILNKTMDNVVVSLKEIGTSASKIKDETKVTAFNSSIIAHNTSVSAFYAKKTAQLVNSLGCLIAFK